MINKSIQEALAEYLEAYPFVLKEHQSYLFFNSKTKQHIKRGRAWKFITIICEDGCIIFEIKAKEKSCPIGPSNLAGGIPYSKDLLQPRLGFG